MDVLERYEPLVDDFRAFRAACERPLPSVVRVNEIKATPERAMDALDDEGVAYEPVEWHPGLLRLDSTSPGRTWGAYHGWLHGQEEVSTLPALVCDPQPDERVWAACAAPGGKATQLAALADDEGTIVANDRSLGRLSALRFNAERLGVTSMAVTNRDARNYSLKPFEFDEFDCALVDAPCSCEGTIRKNPDALDEWSLEYIDSIAATQESILRRAVQATRSGGSVVYSTCTFAPEENEAVLDSVLSAEDCRLVEFSCALETRPGVTEWQGEAFDRSVRKAKRIYPHLNDTGGFFCAKVEVGG
ncbi:RsmB/NOP family class I SAM-dependent RNA methyltransferase [Halococcus thailandensis]|uniref:RNA methylase, NOL1/NOP2/sun family protein n=1 Tax=Halococcus thailandensis JCM 13552 TaxID=1227457 RepID=M0N0F1_9EURY|nr:RsmB/NOP family class I SAM-dependent RNA methyltransferase [Halococcus thailandensis]EMA50559.1 RNA methylase, NOL1/NOP2/sun family protein [Halococcus thailandensis JCM 13552]